MPDNSDVQSRYMQVAEAYAQKKKPKMEDQAAKVFRLKREVLEGKQSQLAAQEAHKREEEARAKLARGDRAENNLKEWMNATRRHENIAEYSDVIHTT